MATFQELIEADQARFLPSLTTTEEKITTANYNPIDDDLAKSIDKPLIPQLETAYEAMPDAERLKLHQKLWDLLTRWDRQTVWQDPLMYVKLVLDRVGIVLDLSDGSIEEILSHPEFYAYDNQGNRIYFIKSLGSGDQRVFLGRVVATDGKERPNVVVKWILGTLGEGTIEDEMKRWQLVQSLGVKTPWIGYDFRFWDQPVLVLEVLQPLDTTDNEFVVGASIVGDLAKLYKVGVHSDLKPDNIMKRVTDKTEYFIIDYGGLATVPLLYGFKRYIWTPLYTSQVPATLCVCTGKNDLLELAYTMRGLQIEEDAAKRPDFYARFPDERDARHGISFKLRAFLERVTAIDERRIIDEDYNELLVILKSEESFPRYGTLG